jgi:transposase
MKQVTLTVQEHQTLEVLTRLDARQFTAAQAAQVLGLSRRQVRRKLQAFRAQGASAVAHHNRGRTPHNALAPALRARIEELVRTKYSAFNHHHAQEMLALHDGIQVSVSTLRRLRQQANLPSSRKRRPGKKHVRRQARPQAGMLLQVDASPFDWLGQGPSLNLVAGIDDATNEAFALLREHEDTVGYLQLLRQVASARGLPLSVYSDRHSIFFSPKAQEPTVEEQLAGKLPQTQFGRAMQELGIGMIPAHSPQAKGRVERLFNTLQDRLTNELHLAGVQTREEANAFLPAFLGRYNAGFAHDPSDPTPAWRPSPANLDQCLCLKFTRVVAPDHAISFGPHRLPVCERSGPSYARKRIEIQVAVDGQFSYWYQGVRIGLGPTVAEPIPAEDRELAQRLPLAPAPQPAAAPPVPAPARPAKSPRAPVTPAPDHVWRRFTIAKPPRVP